MAELAASEVSGCESCSESALILFESISTLTASVL